MGRYKHSNKKNQLIIAVLSLLAVFLMALPANAETATGASLSSDNFKILDSQHSEFGSVSSSSSASFHLTSTIGDFAIGSASSAKFGLRGGFLYFPKVVAATLTTATAGDAQVSLAWIAAEAFQGLRVNGYNVCAKPASSIYTCQAVGNITSYAKSGLTNGTQYTFKIEATDYFGTVIAASNELSATPQAVESPGGGGGVPLPYPPAAGLIGTASVVLKGFAYPDARVIVLRDAQRIGTATADKYGIFQFTSSGLSGGTYKYSLFASSTDGLSSALISFLVTAPSGQETAVEGLVVPPVLSAVDTQLNPGASLVLNGQTFPGSAVIAEILPDGGTITVTAGANGRFQAVISTKKLSNGIYSARVKSLLSNGLESPYSTPVRFGLGVPFKKPLSNIPGCGELSMPDFNCDRQINIVDVSIMMFYFHQKIKTGLYTDLNHDGRVDIADFSILIYYWTG